MENKGRKRRGGKGKKEKEREAGNPCGFGTLVKRILAWKVLNYCKIKKIATEWEGAVRTYKLFTLTPALSTAAHQAQSRALQPRPYRLASTTRLRYGSHPPVADN